MLVIIICFALFVKAEEFQHCARQLLDWLSSAERTLRYQTLAMPDSEEQLEDQLTQLEVFPVNSWSSLLLTWICALLYIKTYLSCVFLLCPRKLAEMCLFNFIQRRASYY